MWPWTGIQCTSAVHICYGYALIGEKQVNPRYAQALEAIAASRAQQISLEYEQPGHEPDVLRTTAETRRSSWDCSIWVRRKWKHRTTSPGASGMRWKSSRRNGLRAAPDCGMWFLPRDVAYAKLQALVAGVALVRASLP